MAPGIASPISVTQLVAGGASSVTVASGATLQLQSVQGNSATYFTESSLKSLTINGAGFNGAGALENVSGNNTWSATPITLGSTASIGADGSSDLTINQEITDGTPNQGFGVTKVGTGTVTYAGTIANSYTGTTNVAAGVLQLDKTSRPCRFSPI